MSMNPAGEGVSMLPDKMTVFQKCVSGFNSSHITANEARSLLTDLIHLFYVGETFPEAEATQLFFTITKLFQKESVGLKQIIYLAIKELVPLTDNVIMGTSVLMRDVQQSSQSMDSKLYKPMALRALCRILDAGAVESMDRLMRSAIVDRDEAVVCAAIVSSYHLLGISRDTVKRWATETMEALSLPGHTVSQYHALGLLYEMRAHDPMALLKLVISIADQNVLRDPNAISLHARLVGELLREQSDFPQLLKILRGYISNRNDIVSLEASKIALSVVKNQDIIVEALNMLLVYMSSPRVVSRFAAVRALNKYADVNPELVASLCNSTLECLISDPNQSVATYAITALLKTGSESSVDSLIESITQNLDDISDDFKLIVVDAVRNLAKRYPAKHNMMLEFFADILRQESELKLQLLVVEAISDLLNTGATMEVTDSSKDSVNEFLLMLCEAIEDSDHPEVTVRILHVLGNIGPKSPNARTVVRFIYNRIILENAVIRAAAVSSLAKFLPVVPDVRKLLEFSLKDPNDEVRDRAAVALNVPTASTELPDKKFSIPDLESALLDYLNGDAETELDVSSIPLISSDEKAKRRLGFDETLEEDARLNTVGHAAPETKPEEDLNTNDTEAFAEILSSIPEIAKLGQLLYTAKPANLTDEDMEYIVSHRVHVFADHLVLQYDIKNNYELDLTNVGVQIDLGLFDDEQLTEEFALNINELKAYESGTVYIGLKRTDMVVGTVPSTLTFTGEAEGEEYALDDLEIVPSAYISPASTESFSEKWSNMENEEVGTQQLSGCSTLESAIIFLQKKLGLKPVEGTGFVTEEETTHTVKMFGKSLDDAEVAATIRLVRSSRAGVAGKIMVRSTDPSASFIVAEGF